MGGHQQPAVLRQFLEETEPHAGGFLGVVLEAVVPVGMIEAHGEYRVAGKVSRSSPPIRSTTLCPGYVRR